MDAGPSNPICRCANRISRNLNHSGRVVKGSPCKCFNCATRPYPMAGTKATCSERPKQGCQFLYWLSIMRDQWAKLLTAKTLATIFTPKLLNLSAHHCTNFIFIYNKTHLLSLFVISSISHSGDKANFQKGRLK